MRGSAGFLSWRTKVSGMTGGLVFATPAFAAADDLAKAWFSLLDHDPATLLLYGSIGLLGVALALKLAIWAAESQSYQPHFFPTDRRIPIEPPPS